jgi:hypothetical protein
LNSEWRLEGHPFADGQTPQQERKDDQGKERIKKRKRKKARRKNWQVRG